MTIKTLEAGIIALGWQGGTIYQVIEEAELLFRDNKHNKSTYLYGFNRGQNYDLGADIHEYPIPVNSWDSNPCCTLSYIAGLKAGLQSRKTSFTFLKGHTMHELKNLNTFMTSYENHLRLCREKYPYFYSWHIEELPDILSRMKKAIFEGTFSKDSPAFKATCKELGIKHTYKAIKEYLIAA